MVQRNADAAEFDEAVRLQQAGRLEEAEAKARRALGPRPEHPAALRLLGRVAVQRGRCQEAVDLLRRAAVSAPSDALVHNDLAAALGACGCDAEAERQARTAVDLSPDLPEAWNNLGAALRRQGRNRQAGAAFARALRLRVDYPEAHRNLADVLRAVGRVSEALREYHLALELRPDYYSALDGLAGALVDMGETEQVIATYRKLVELHPRLPDARSGMLYTLHYSPTYDAEALFHEHLEWGRLFCDPLREQIKRHDNVRDPERRLRLGHVSPDLREHTVTKFITAAMEHHDRERFELFCYSDVEKPDAVTQRLRRVVENWHETRKLKDAELEALIRRHRIDILVDLRGHAAANRLTLFARKPAPVQVNMVGYFNTTGLATMDYRITDEHQDPPGMTEKYHTERLVRLPNSCWCYTADAGALEVSEPPALKNGYITFGSLNKIVKVSEPCARLWAQVLEAVPKSRLVLSVAEHVAQPPSAVLERSSKETVPRTSAFGGTQPRAAVPPGSPVRDHLSRMGLPMDRVDLLGKTLTRRQYLERFDRIDIALDTFPFNGITTTCDGLWQGVPCVSLAGQTGVSRAGRSILRASNLPGLGTDTPEAFVRAAVELATDLDRLRALRLSMRQRLLASPLMDHVGFARNLEAAYRQMWRAWCASG